ncbi:MAG: hypothetical protein WD734_05965 [Dehalococcoidia bacterium]
MSVVHVICATLRSDATDEAVAHALDLARDLAGAEGVTRVLAGRGERQLVAVTWLAGREALEPFAASPAHMAFIMRGLAPCISGMWSAAVESDAAPPDGVASLWVFALQAAGGLFEWQVRELLDAIEVLPGHAAIGVTVEERERYRAGGAVCLTSAEVAEFGAALAAARSRWGEPASAVIDAAVTVVDVDR